MEYYKYDIKDIYKELESSKDGLSTQEVSKRLKHYGNNKLSEGKKKSNLSKFLSEFNDIMIIILIISAIVSFILSYINNESFTDSIIIMAIVIINAIMGFVQELKADKSIDALKKMQSTTVKVRRDNKIFSIDSEYIVPGDILVLEAGDIVCADARIISSISLKVDEASLTGESLPVEKITDVIKKDVSLSERNNMVYSGTNIVYGKCEAIVCLTGNNTEFGKIANDISKIKEDLTPLQRRISDISKFLSIIIAIIIILMFLIGLVKGMPLKEVIMLSISLAVAAIPEGLPAIITIILSIGMIDLAKKKAIVRKMSSVETLGCTEVICSDKTGTITQNKMTVIEVYYNGKIQKVEDLNKNNKLFNIMILNNDSENDVGDPTELALINCLKNIVDVDKIKENNNRIDEIPFDSNRKMMSIINKNKNNIELYTKGSFDSVIKICKYIYEDNKIKKLTNKKREELIKIEQNESKKAYRMLAYAYKIIENNKISEDNLIFVGMTAMVDLPREGVKESINMCKNANIKPIMITGDSLFTAKAIAKDIGILENEEEAIIGYELDQMSFEELKNNVENYSVYARVSPTNKLDIVNALKENGKLVAMTGDGVNDAPALKSANIGVGMGISGTEVSKNVSDIVLADDSFSSIVTAVKEGRRIFDNIRNAIVYLLTGNIAEILVVFLGMLFGVEIFLPIQLLYINLITDSLPAIALAFEKESDDIMNRKVRKHTSSFFTQFLIAKMLSSALLKTVSILLIYIINLQLYNHETATTMAFLTLILQEMFYAISCRNIKETILNNKFFENKHINISILILIIIQFIVFMTPIKNIFNIVDLNIYQVIYCILFVIIIFIIDELTKGLINRLFKD